MDFTQGGRLTVGEEDEERLAVLFSALGFDVKIHRNLTGKEIYDQVKLYGARQHTGAFFLAILSHGTSVSNRPAVLGTDSKEVVVNDLERFFYASNCNSLHGRPKIFLIDACRGSQEEKTFNPLSTSGTTTTKISASLRHLRCSDSITIRSERTFNPGPLSAGGMTTNASLRCSNRVATRSDSVDFLIIYATTDGNISFTTRDGSHLTQAFVKVTSKADETDSLQEIIRKVRVKIQECNPHQTVEATDRLTYKYLIKRYFSYHSSVVAGHSNYAPTIGHNYNIILSSKK